MTIIIAMPPQRVKFPSSSFVSWKMARPKWELCRTRRFFSLFKVHTEFVKNSEKVMLKKQCRGFDKSQVCGSQSLKKDAYTKVECIDSKIVQPHNAQMINNWTDENTHMFFKTEWMLATWQGSDKVVFFSSPAVADDFGYRLVRTLWKIKRMLLQMMMHFATPQQNRDNGIFFLSPAYCACLESDAKLTLWFCPSSKLKKA